MERTRYRLRLDLNDPAAAVTIHAKRCDSGRSILATLLSGGAVYPVSDDLSAVFTARKPDGKVLYNACTIEAGRIRYDLTPQTTAAAGLMECELRLFRGEQLITSPRFHLMVEDTVYDENAEIESTSEFTTLTGLVGRIEEMLQRGDFKGEPFTYEDFTAEQLEDLRASLYGYYIPSVSGAGDLTWQPTGDTMPAVPTANIRGPAPVPGADYFTEADKAAMVSQVLAKTGETFAPAGYGLGTNAPGVTEETLGETLANGWYAFTPAAGVTLCGISFRYGHLRVDNFDGSSARQTLYTVSGQNTVLRRECCGGVWGEWECENPPMTLGVAYRTTERWNGKPVYRKLVDVGILPSNTHKSLQVSELVGAEILQMHLVRSRTDDVTTWYICGENQVELVGRASGTVYVTYNADNAAEQWAGCLLLKYAK